MLKTIIIAFIIFFCQVSSSLANNYPMINSQIMDMSKVLDPDVKNTMNTQLVRYKEKTGNNVVIAIVGSLSGINIELYAKRLNHYWELDDRSLLILLAIEDRQVHIDVGEKLEIAFTDYYKNEIIQNIMLPYLRFDLYEQALLNGIEAVFAVTLNKKIKNEVYFQEDADKALNEALISTTADNLQKHKLLKSPEKLDKWLNPYSEILNEYIYLLFIPFLFVGFVFKTRLISSMNDLRLGGAKGKW